MVAALPDDVLAEVLRRLAPRCLAACRCVCKPWRDLVDDRRLLLLLRAEELLPRPLAGIFLNFFGLFNSEFFARRPSTGAAAAISGDLDFLPTYTTYGSREYQIQDHCNGPLDRGRRVRGKPGHSMVGSIAPMPAAAARGDGLLLCPLPRL
jgi:hypothetical protein